MRGAYATLMSDKKRSTAQGVAEIMVYIDLLTESDFIEEYASAVYIPGKKEYFSRDVIT